MPSFRSNTRAQIYTRIIDSDGPTVSFCLLVCWLSTHKMHIYHSFSHYKYNHIFMFINETMLKLWVQTQNLFYLKSQSSTILYFSPMCVCVFVTVTASLCWQPQWQLCKHLCLCLHVHTVFQTCICVYTLFSVNVLKYIYRMYTVCEWVLWSKCA